MDIHHHFHPVGYMLASNEDCNSYVCSLESTRNSRVKIFGNGPNVHHTLNDDSDAMFKAFPTVFPLAFLMNCFAHVIARNLVKHACKLNDKGKYTHAKHDLIKGSHRLFISH